MNYHNYLFAFFVRFQLCYVNVPTVLIVLCECVIVAIELVILFLLHVFSKL